MAEYLIMQNLLQLQFYQIDWYFDFMIVNAKSTAEHKYLLQNGRNMFKGFTKIIETIS